MSFSDKYLHEAFGKIHAEQLNQVALIKLEKIKAAGDKLAFLMLNGTTAEMRQAIWEWRELVPSTKSNLNDPNGDNHNS